MKAIQVTSFKDWRKAARELLEEEVPPEQVFWSDAPTLLPGDPRPQVPPAFIRMAEKVACHRDEQKWPLLYNVLWRLTHDEPNLLDDAADEHVHALMAMEKAVARDAHKMEAFVRFRETHDGLGSHWIAWHRPDHRIVRLVAPFFVSRFGVMRWTILTPDESAAWDGTSVRFGPGVPRSEAPAEDELEDLWRAYYAAVFNPARIKLKQMRKEMPVRHWATLPETRVIDDLLRDAPRRMEEMMKKAACPTTTSAADFLPEKLELPVLAKASQRCKGCGIYCNATQTVFGEGPADATCMFVGEQPGDQEDLAGKPFVGPSGQLLSEVMEEAGIPRDEVYVTNAVKHFKWEPRGKRRIHSKPSAREVAACRPWLEAEIKVVKPKLIVCLGATAAQSLLGPAFRLTHHRGEPQKQTPWADWLLATVHPSSLLRIPDPAGRAEARAQFADDLKLVARQLRSAR